MTSHQEDLHLLLSLDDKVLETPPSSPSSSSGYLSDDERRKKREPVDMSVFRNAVQDFIENEPQSNSVDQARSAKRSKKSNDAGVEKFSGLRLRNNLLTPEELGDHFSDIRFIRLPAIRNSLIGDSISGSWVTVGVLSEKSDPKTSSAGKKYCIWKIGCLDERTVSVFLFGDAYQKYWKEQAGTVFALFNCGIRKDPMGKDYSLSVYSANQMLKMGTSLDYGVCKGKRRDGMACTISINKSKGTYCKFHKSRLNDKYTVTRNELKGGNLRTSFSRPFRSEGIYVVDPLAEKTNLIKSKQPRKLLSVDCLKKALSNAGKVTTNTHSQGIRILKEIIGKKDAQSAGSEFAKQHSASSEKRPLHSVKRDPSSSSKPHQSDAKRKKTEKHQSPAATEPTPPKLIELEFVSSDEECSLH